MSRTTLLSGLCILTLAQPIGAARPEDIPPNCTLDPFTHKMNCPIPANCTLDPFTHMMNCHAAAAQKGELQSQQSSQSTLKKGP